MTEHYAIDLFRPGTAVSAIVDQALSFRQPKLTPPQSFRRLDVIMGSSFPVFLNCSRESREVPEFIVPTLVEKNTNFFG